MSQEMFQAPVVSRVPAGRWTVASASSSAGFTVGNLGVKRVSGTIPIRSADAEVDTSGTIITLRAKLDLAAIATGNRRRDADLAKPHLLDTASYPVLEFVGGPSVSTTHGWQVVGSLTARGVSIRVELHVAVTGVNPGGSITVRASTRFDRTELGLRAPRFMIGRWIDVQIVAVVEPAH